MKILYLEDNKFDAELTQIELRKAFINCRLDIAKTITDAVHQLKEKPDYDIAILDLHLPDGNGIDCLTYIRQNKLQIAVIILTGSGNEESAIAALKAGADDYLTKTTEYLTKLPGTILMALENHKKNIERSAKPLNILYVEWNKPDIDFTLRHFQKYAPHIQTQVVQVAEEALELLPNSPQQSCPFDVLLMDYRLPGLNALDTIKIIRQERKLPISIVLVSGHGNEEIAVQALKLGADEYLVKRKNYLFRLPSILASAYHRHELERQQKTLRESEYKYRLLAENSSDVIFILDLDLNHRYISPSVKQLRGYEVEEAFNQNLYEILTPESYNHVIQLLKSVSELFKKENYEQIESRIIELEMRKKDGTTVWTEVKVTVSVDENNIPIGIQGAARDISKRKEALDDLRKKSHAIDQSPVFILITDTKGNIEYVNPYFTKITGYSFDEVMGKNPKFLKSGNTPPEVYEVLWEKITSGNIWTGELQNRKKDGTLYWESASISPIVDEAGKTTHYLGVKEDITAKKKYEQDLIIARDQALESNRLKSAFLATMSHELRTPLNAIIGFSDLMDENISQSDISEFAKIINNSGNHLLNIIEDVFTVSLLQAKQSKVFITEHTLSSYFRDFIQYAKVELIQRNKENLKLRFNKEIVKSNIVVKSDKTKISQVIINFIKNAIEYTKEGEIEIGVINKDQDITFYVRDTGIGIPANKMEIIFEHFRQLDNSYTRIHNGVGLGLAICSEIQKLLNGNIWVESEEGKGSTFYFSLQNVLSKTEKQIEEDFTQKPPNLKNKTILIVEDEETNFMLLKTILKKTNASIIWAKSGEESIDICKTNSHIDLVFMDIKMPGIDGFEATKQIKQFASHLPIVAQTAYALESDKIKMIEFGFGDYLSKPIEIKKLMSLLIKYLK